MDAEPVHTVELLDMALTVVVMATVAIVLTGACAGAASHVTATVVTTWGLIWETQEDTVLTTVFTILCEEKWI